MTYQYKDIYLVGMPGSGKSTLGKSFAAHLQRNFLDLDHHIERTEGVSIPQIFDKGGETYFRELEAKHLRGIKSTALPQVIATGGGTPCYSNNMAYINDQAVSIYLEVPEEILVQRLMAQTMPRPLVEGKSETELLLFLSEQLIERKPYYRRATLVVSGIDLQVDHLVTALHSL